MIFIEYNKQSNNNEVTHTYYSNNIIDLHSL